MPNYVRRTILDHPRERVFRWHTRPGALERLLPPWEDVGVVDREGGLEDGGTVTLEAKRGPVTASMTVRHTAYEEGRMFRDEQVSGPFRSWVHDHVFEPVDPGRTEIRDEVQWELPLAPASAIFGGGVVEDELDRGFRWRHRRLASDLDRQAAHPDVRPLTVALSGSTGLVGRGLTHFLTTAGHRVLRLVRSRRRAEKDPDSVYWSVPNGEIDAAALEGVDGVVHLAGEPIAGVRWTAAKKEAILESRKLGTELLASTLARLKRPPRVLVAASGVHYYGHRGNRPTTEEAAAGDGFLARVCREWEAGTEEAARAGIRVVNLRMGMVLSPAGGALGTMLLPFKMGIGGRLGSGNQYVAWVDHDDAVGAFFHALITEELSGPVNATSPHPVTNATFTSALGRVLGRPTLVPVPSLAVKAAFGQMGRELLLEGVRAVPRKLEESGFRFHFPGLEDSLRFELGRLV